MKSIYILQALRCASIRLAAPVRHILSTPTVAASRNTPAARHLAPRRLTAALAIFALGLTGGIQTAGAGHPEDPAEGHAAEAGSSQTTGHTSDPYLNTLPTGNPNRVVVNAPVPIDLSADVMAGIEGVYLVLEPFSADFAGWKRGPQQVAEQVRTRLAAAGIPLLSKSEYEARANAAALVLALHANANSYGFYSYAWKIVVSDKERLNGASNWLARPLWSTGENGVLVPGNFVTFDANLDKTLDRFINAYAARNRG